MPDAPAAPTKKRTKHGRPSRLTPEVLAKFREGILKTGYLKYACMYAGIGVVTARRWARKGERRHDGKYREFLEVMRSGQAEVRVLLMQRIVDASSKDWRAAVPALRVLDARSWQQRVEVGGIKKGSPIQVEQSRSLKNLTDAELDQLEALLARQAADED